MKRWIDVHAPRGECLRHATLAPCGESVSEALNSWVNGDRQGTACLVYVKLPFAESELSQRKQGGHACEERGGFPEEFGEEYLRDAFWLADVCPMCLAEISLRFMAPTCRSQTERVSSGGGRHGRTRYPAEMSPCADLEPPRAAPLLHMADRNRL